jgi:soluble lytic murein transglycosylase-like protein
MAMRLFALALALVVVSEPALARKSSRPRPQPTPVDAMVAPPAWQPEPQFVPALPVRQRRSHRAMVMPVQPSDGLAPAFAPQPSLVPQRTPSPEQGALAAMAARHAQMNGVPESLVHRVIMRESRYNPRAVSRGNYGLMQIRLGTARAMGYTGSAAGLLDPETNMTYAVRYLAGAYQAAGGNPSRAVAYYASGYHGRAKQRVLTPPVADAFGRTPPTTMTH